jgi:hypothetical protein
MTALRLRIALTLSVAGVLLGATPCRADGITADAATHEASIHFERGVKLFQDQDSRGALIEFERAYAVSPNYRVLYNIGQCRYQLRDYAGALEAFQKYLTEGDAHLTAERRKLVQANIDELGERVARVRISSNRVGADVTIDDTPVGTTPLDSPITVSAGRRKIVLTKSGETDVVRVVDIAGQDTMDLALDFAPTEPPPTPSPSAIDDIPFTVQPVRRPSIAPAIVAFGGAAAGAGVGAIFGIWALQNKHSLDQACVDKECPPSSQALINESQRNALVSTVGFAAGAVSLAAGIAFVVVARGSGSRSPESAANVNLIFGPGFAGVRGIF